MALQVEGILLLVLVAATLAVVVHCKEQGPEPADKNHLVAQTLAMDDQQKYLIQSGMMNRRQLYKSGYISYEALKRNSIPCGRHGGIYYNCHRKRRANPYRRGCSRITYCARNSKSQLN